MTSKQIINNNDAAGRFVKENNKVYQYSGLDNLVGEKVQHQTTIFQTVKDISFLLLLIYWGYCFWAIFKITRWVAAFATDHSCHITCVILQAAVILLAGSQLIWVKLSAKKIKWISSAAFTVVFQIICALAVAILIMLD